MISLLLIWISFWTNNQAKFLLKSGSSLLIWNHPYDMSNTILLMVRIFFLIKHEKSTLIQVMAWCQMAPSHYPNQCWLFCLGARWHQATTRTNVDFSVSHTHTKKYTLHSFTYLSVPVYSTVMYALVWFVLSSVWPRSYTLAFEPRHWSPIEMTFSGLMKANWIY